MEPIFQRDPEHHYVDKYFSLHTASTGFTARRTCPVSEAVCLPHAKRNIGLARGNQALDSSTMESKGRRYTLQKEMGKIMASSFSSKKIQRKIKQNRKS